METIRIYLDNMFMNLPNTAKVQRAKRELLQMMEDKYTELKESGKTENEAVGIVISEFGNLEEIAESLGISGILHPEERGQERHEEKGFYEIPARMVTFEEAQQFLRDKKRSAVFIATGVLLCITSVCGPIIGDALYKIDHVFMRAVGIVGMFVMIAVAVALFILSGIGMDKWNWLEKKPFVTDFSTKAYVEQKREQYRYKYAVSVTAGVACCVLCMAVVVLFDEIAYGIWEEISDSFFFIMIGVGVFLIVLPSVVQNGYNRLLETGRESSEPEYYSPAAEKLMSVYWPTITCIYLCWSFLTFDWHLTWVIWPIAGVVRRLIGLFATKG